MTHSHIHKTINHILAKEMRGFHFSASLTASFELDFFLSRWEINWLLSKVEENFGIRLEQGMEENLSSMNQLVNIVYARLNPALKQTPDFC